MKFTPNAHLKMAGIVDVAAKSANGVKNGALKAWPACTVCGQSNQRIWPKNGTAVAPQSTAAIEQPVPSSTQPIEPPVKQQSPSFYRLVDDPGPFSPVSEWEEHLAELELMSEFDRKRYSS